MLTFSCRRTRTQTSTYLTDAFNDGKGWVCLDTFAVGSGHVIGEKLAASFDESIPGVERLYLKTAKLIDLNMRLERHPKFGRSISKRVIG